MSELAVLDLSSRYNLLYYQDKSMISGGFPQVRAGVALFHHLAAPWPSVGISYIEVPAYPPHYGKYV